MKLAPARAAEAASMGVYPTPIPPGGAMVVAVVAEEGLEVSWDGMVVLDLV